MVISWSTLVWRRIERRSAIECGDPEPTFDESDLRSNWTWDSVAGFMMAGAVAMLLLGII
jgi:hypothetical protein